jgi:hypothetical protein
MHHNNTTDQPKFMDDIQDNASSVPPELTSCGMLPSTAVSDLDPTPHLHQKVPLNLQLPIHNLVIQTPSH